MFRYPAIAWLNGTTKIKTMSAGYLLAVNYKRCTSSSISSCMNAQGHSFLGPIPIHVTSESRSCFLPVFRYRLSLEWFYDWQRPIRHYASRIDESQAHEIVLLDVFEIRGVAERRDRPEQVLHPLMDGRISVPDHG